MGTTLQTQFLPETDVAGLGSFRVDGALAIRSVLRELIRKRALVVLYDVRDPARFVASQVIEVGDRDLQLEFVTDDRRRQSILDAGAAIVVAFLEQIKIQFEARGLRASGTADALSVTCAIPDVLYRIQRRDAYRVRPLATDEAMVHVQDGRGGEHPYRMIDMSASGVAFAWPADEPPPELGTPLPRCRIGFAERPPLPVALVIRQVSEGLAAEGGMRRIGCEYGALPPEIARAVQMTVLDFETRAARTR